MRLGRAEPYDLHGSAATYFDTASAVFEPCWSLSLFVLLALTYTSYLHFHFRCTAAESRISIYHVVLFFTVKVRCITYDMRRSSNTKSVHLIAKLPIQFPCQQTRMELRRGKLHTDQCALVETDPNSVQTRNAEHNKAVTPTASYFRSEWLSCNSNQERWGRDKAPRVCEINHGKDAR